MSDNKMERHYKTDIRLCILTSTFCACVTPYRYTESVVSLRSKPFHPNIMSDFHIYIKMPSYLRQWFIHRHSGTDPMRLNNGSIESKLIKLAVVRPPECFVPHRQQEDEVAICIPYSKSRDPRTYNHITDTGKRALLENIKNAFDVDAGRSFTISARLASSRRT